MLKKLLFAAGRFSETKADIAAISPKKILVFKVGAIGDVVMTTPFVRALRKRFPNAQVDYWTGKWSAPMLENNPHVKCVSFPEKDAESFFGLAKLRSAIKKEKYSLAFILDRSYKANLFIASCGIPVRIGFDRHGEGVFLTKRIPYTQDRHDVKAYVQLLQPFKVKNAKTDMELFLSKEEIAFACKFFAENSLSGRVLGVFPGGGKNPGQTLTQKRWGEEKFGKVCQQLSKKGWKILLVGGPSDADVIEHIQKYGPFATTLNKANIRQTAAIIKKCDKFLTNDGGPMHIAGAVGTPVVSIFGPTNPNVLAPLGKKNIFIWKHPAAPCYDIYGKITKSHACMEKITIADVVRAVK